MSLSCQKTLSLGICTGLKIPSSSSPSSCPCWPGLSPCSPAPLPPFSRPLGLFRLLPLAVAGPTSPSGCFPERWMSLCLCQWKRRARGWGEGWEVDAQRGQTIATRPHQVPRWSASVLPWRAWCGGRSVAWSWRAGRPRRRTACGGWGWGARPPWRLGEAPGRWLGLAEGSTSIQGVKLFEKLVFKEALKSQF